MNLHSLILLSADVTVDKPTGFLGSLATAAEDFIKVFNKGGSVLLSLMGGILPTLIVLLSVGAGAELGEDGEEGGEGFSGAGGGEDEDVATVERAAPGELLGLRCRGEVVVKPGG